MAVPVGSGAPNEMMRVGGTTVFIGDGSSNQDGTMDNLGDLVIGSMDGTTSHLALDLNEIDCWTGSRASGATMNLQYNSDGNINLAQAGGDVHMCAGSPDRGRVGIGTSSPTGHLHVVYDSNATNNADIPALKVSGDTSKSDSGGIVAIYNSDTSMETGDSMLRMDASDSSFASDNYWISFVYSSTVLGSINSEVAYTPFTGQHPTKLKDDVIPLEGSIIKTTGNIVHKEGISNAWVETEPTSTEKDKASVGVYRGEWSNQGPVPGMLHVYNAIGEGQILVTDEGGDIEPGDYICSSNRSGHGMLQDDDILHNYTVAKATEGVDFSSISVDPELGYKSVLLACTYHAG